MQTLQGHPKEVAEELAKLDRTTQMAVIESVLGDHSVCKSFLGATGRLPDLQSLEGKVGNPFYTPVLRPIKYGFTDTEKILSNTRKMIFFADNRQFADGTPKTSAHTNMTQCGQLGTPLVFDLTRLELHFEGNPEVARRVMERMSFTFYFGCNTPWLRVPASAWKPLVALPYRKLEDADYKRIADTLQERGLFWGHYWHRIDSGGRPRRIESNEAFRAEIEFDPLPAFEDELLIQVSMHDTLYAQL